MQQPICLCATGKGHSDRRQYPDLGEGLDGHAAVLRDRRGRAYAVEAFRAWTGATGHHVGSVLRSRDPRRTRSTTLRIALYPAFKPNTGPSNRVRRLVLPLAQLRNELDALNHMQGILSKSKRQGIWIKVDAAIRASSGQKPERSGELPMGIGLRAVRDQ